MKIVVLDGYALNPGDLSWDSIRQFGEITIYDRTPSELIQERIGDAEIILLNKTPITAETLENCPSVKLICVLATGYNVVDCDAAKARNIPVCNVPAYGTAAVSQFTFALLLELCHQVGHHSQTVHNGNWCRNLDFCYWDTPQMELAGKTLGIIGFGRIGRAVGAIAKAFGMRVIAFNRSQCVEGEAIGEYVDLETLLTTSDVISLHCPLTPATENIICRENLAKMKDGAILINTARGQLVEEAALVEALQRGKLRGAAVDVVTKEPMAQNNPLLNAPNCIITPHMAWAPVESRQRIMDCTARSIAAYLEGQPINTVNM